MAVTNSDFGLDTHPWSLQVYCLTTEPSCLAQLEFLATIENIMSTNVDGIQVNTEMINVNIDSENCCNWSDELLQDGSNKSM